MGLEKVVEEGFEVFRLNKLRVWLSQQFKNSFAYALRLELLFPKVYYRLFVYFFRGLIKFFNFFDSFEQQKFKDLGNFADCFHERF